MRFHQSFPMHYAAKGKLCSARCVTQVLIGGGENHRMGLFDMVMVKDNHIAVAGGIPQAISAVEKYLSSKNLDIGVEVFAIL